MNNRSLFNRNHVNFGAAAILVEMLVLSAAASVAEAQDEVEGLFQRLEQPLRRMQAAVEIKCSGITHIPTMRRLERTGDNTASVVNNAAVHSVQKFIEEDAASIRQALAGFMGGRIELYEYDRDPRGVTVKLRAKELPEDSDRLKDAVLRFNLQSFDRDGAGAMPAVETTEAFQGMVFMESIGLRGSAFSNTSGAILNACQAVLAAQDREQAGAA